MTISVGAHEGERRIGRGTSHLHLDPSGWPLKLNQISEHEVRRVLVDHEARIEETDLEAIRAAFADPLIKVELEAMCSKCITA